MNRADAIESDELAKKNQCKSCVGLNLSELKRKAHYWDSIDAHASLIRNGEFLIKAMGQLSGDAYIAAEMKLADIVGKL